MPDKLAKPPWLEGPIDSITVETGADPVKILLPRTNRGEGFTIQSRDGFALVGGKKCLPGTYKWEDGELRNADD